MMAMTRTGKIDLALAGVALVIVLFVLVSGGDARFDGEGGAGLSVRTFLADEATLAAARSAVPVAALLACRAGDCAMSDRGGGGRALPVATGRLPEAGRVAAECRPDHPCAVVLTLRAGPGTPDATRLRWLPRGAVAVVATD